MASRTQITDFTLIRTYTHLYVSNTYLEVGKTSPRERHKPQEVAKITIVRLQLQLCYFCSRAYVFASLQKWHHFLTLKRDQKHTRSQKLLHDVDRFWEKIKTCKILDADIQNSLQKRAWQITKHFKDYCPCYYSCAKNTYTCIQLYIFTLKLKISWLIC